MVVKKAVVCLGSRTTEKAPSVKQFLASRRRLLRIQKSFMWASLTPVPEGSGVGTDAVADRGHGVETDIVEANSSLKSEVQEEDGCLLGSSECGSVSDVSAYDLIEQSASCQDVYNQSEDTKQQCFILINALGTHCSSQTDSNGLPNVPFSELNSCSKDEAIEEHDHVSGSARAETASKVNTDGHTKQFVGWEDDQGANGRSGNEIADLDSNKCGEVDSSCSGDGNINCHIGTFSVQFSSNTEVDSAQKISVIESSEGPRQVIKEECIDITGNILDGFDDDYNLTSLFAECKNDSSRESDSNFLRQFNIPTDVGSPLDKSPFEFSISSEAEKVDLRHQVTEERREVHDWMLDYALTNTVRKVQLLVEAFETVTPLSECETIDLPHATRAFTCSTPIQACN